MSRLLSFIISVFFLSNLGAQEVIPIADARNMSNGTEITIQGIVTNGEELGGVRYIQDSTAGMAMFPGTGSISGFTDAVNTGVLAKVTGIIAPFNNLFEITPIFAFEVISENNQLPEPRVLTISEMSEDYEGQLIQINNVVFTNAGGTFDVGTEEITDESGTGVMYIRTSHPLIGTEIPKEPINMTGLLGQFIDEYQILPRGPEDFETFSSISFDQLPTISNLSTNTFQVNWSSNIPTEGLLTVAKNGELVYEQSFEAAIEQETLVEGLEPATIYDVDVTISLDNSEVAIPGQRIITRSTSSGETRIYFSHSVDPVVGFSEEPDGDDIQEVDQALLQYIRDAQANIDIAMFNNSYDRIKEELNNAVGRGVQVRYLTDINSANQALSGALFPVLTTAPGDPLMHNKFIIFDHGNVDSSWIMTSSSNLSNTNFFEDINNFVFIQDQGLARVYLEEFNEMWGSTELEPDAQNALSGSEKSNNVPHEVYVNDQLIEVYFSPSDGTNDKLESTIQSADENASFAILSFTRDDLAAAIAIKNSAGVDVRGMINNAGDTGGEFQTLVDAGVNVLEHTPNISLHHKYLVVDALTDSDPIVVTGSHNWSSAAEFENDENTLIIHSARVAEVFQQEFETRWCELNPGGCRTTSLREYQSTSIFTVFPNPVANQLNLQMNQELSAGTIEILDLSGRNMLSVIPGKFDRFHYQIGVEHLQSGVYSIVVKDLNKKIFQTAKFVKQ